jgi:hypothetical protein
VPRSPAGDTLREHRHSGFATARALAEGMRALCAHSTALPRGFWRGSFCVHACVRVRALVVWVCDWALPSPRTRRRQVECGQVVPAGVGYLVTTYLSDGNPLPTFSGSPLFGTHPVPRAAASVRANESTWANLSTGRSHACHAAQVPLNGSAVDRRSTLEHVERRYQGRPRDSLPHVRQIARQDSRPQELAARTSSRLATGSVDGPGRCLSSPLANASALASAVSGKGHARGLVSLRSGPCLA